MNNINPIFIMQSAISLLALAFCMVQLSNNEKPDQTYWIIFSSIIAYWLPSPSQGNRNSK